MIKLFIPYVNRYSLLIRAFTSCVSAKVDVNIINNSGMSLAGAITPPVPLTFAQAQNWMLQLAEGDPFYLFMHSDAEAGKGTIDKLVEMAYGMNERKWGAIFTAYDALAAFNTDAMRTVGGWDTFLEWYASDNDMYRRLRLARYETIDSNLPVLHTPSQTLNSDPLIKLKVDLMIPCRQAYYRAKWGGDPGHETFNVPFGKEI